MSAGAWNIIGLILTLVGVVMLFLFGMPFRVRASGGEPITTIPTIAGQKAEKRFSALGWIGLAMIVLGTAFQIVGNL